MGVLNPIEDTFLKEIMNTRRRLSSIERARQPYVGDWNDFNVSDFSYQSNNILNVNTDMPVDQFFKVGDKFRINQSGYKYFYIIALDTTNNRIQISGGDDYTFTNAAFTEVSNSRLTNPSGHPLVFDFSTSMTVYTFVASWNNDSARFTGGTGSKSGKFSMMGNLVVIWYSAGTTNMRANVVTVNFSSPIIQGPATVGNSTSTILTTGAISGGADIHVSVLYNPVEPSGMGAVIIANRLLGSPFDSGAWGLDFTMIGIV